MKSASACFLAIIATMRLFACTTAVVSGKATADGRPILWKNRDAPDIHNQVVYLEDGRYPYLGIVNCGDAAGLQIWAGLNSEGFAIMNNVSYNLEMKEEDSVMEGHFMKLALQSCATVEDFQALLERSNIKGRMVAANFGVIDAKGGAAYFETNEKSFRRYDAAAAPGGFLVRTNYSHCGKKEDGTGFIREARAQELVGTLQTEGRLLPESLLAEVSRDTANARIGSYPSVIKKGYAYIGDSLSRQETSSAFVVAGVRPGEAPSLSTAWAILGLPATGVAVPLWVEAKSVPAELAAGKDYASLNTLFDRIRLYLYPEQAGELKRYMDAARMYDPKVGLAKPLLSQEHENFAAQAAAVKAGTPRKEIQERIAHRTLERVREILKEAGVPEASVK